MSAFLHRDRTCQELALLLQSRGESQIALTLCTFPGTSPKDDNQMVRFYLPSKSEKLPVMPQRT